MVSFEAGIRFHRSPDVVDRDLHYNKLAVAEPSFKNQRGHVNPLKAKHATMDKTILDWINLLLPYVSQSLWQPLHDGKLLTIHSDLLGRTVVLEVDVPHIRQFHKINDGLCFIITLLDVESVRTNAFSEWPGPVPEVQGKSWEEQSRLVEEYQAKWREESVGWEDFIWVCFI